MDGNQTATKTANTMMNVELPAHTPEAFRRHRGGRLLLALALLVQLVSLGCATVHRNSPQRQDRGKAFSATVSLHGRPFDLHFAVPVHSVAPDILVLYASGDGGWFGAAVDMFAQFGRDGYYAAGFSSRAFLNLERSTGELINRGQIADEYRQIIAQARTALGLATSTRTVLTGWSRGAAFAVLVGADRNLQPELAGVIAIGLPDEEELQVRSDSDDTRIEGEVAKTTHRMRYDTYRLIPTLEAMPCAVIQSTRDDYLPAGEARRLFGPDTAVRRLYAVDARNHRFSGGNAQFGVALGDALQWVVAHSYSMIARDVRP